MHQYHPQPGVGSALLLSPSKNAGMCLHEASVLAGSCEQGAKYAFSCRRMEVFWIICRAKRLCWYAQQQNKGLKMPLRNIFVSEMFNFGHEIRDYPLNHEIIMFSSRQMRSAGSARLFTSQRAHTHTHHETPVLLLPFSRGLRGGSVSHRLTLMSAYFLELVSNRPRPRARTFLPRQVLGLADTKCFSHILALPRICLSRKFGDSGRC